MSRFRLCRNLVLVVLLWPALGWAQGWTNILDDTRATDWSVAGAGTTMVTRTTACASFTPSSGTAAAINAAIQACGSGQYISLGAGTYTLTTGLTFLGKSNVTLRGAGADSTFLNFTGSNACGGSGTVAAICVSPASPQFIIGAGGQNASWTAGYAQGSSTITISTKTGLVVGAMMVIGQARDASDTGNVYVCTASTCSNGSGSESFGSGRGQGSIVFVTSISGGACPCTIGITPALRMPNWRSGQSPNVQYETNTHISGVGIENLSVNYDGVQVIHGISFYQASHSWIKGVRSVNPGVSGSAAKHVRLVAAANITIRDSYFWGGKDHTAESYGIAPLGVSNLLVENNIFQYITSPIVNEGNEGSVFAYNYSIDDLFSDGTWAQASWYHHSNSNNYLLWESNDGFGLTADIHAGGAFFITAFRNRALGKEAVNTSQTVPIHLYGFNRYENIIGNVLGDNAYHTTYQTRAGLEAETNCNLSIYALGWGGNCGAGGPLNDSLVNTTLMRWGNYDTVNDATRFVSGEVPSGLSLYANAVPSSETLPATFYLDGKPPFFGTQDWPAIGPDVTGGSETGVGGHNAKIPARRCFEDTMGGAFGQRTTARTFNATTCYGTVNTYQAATCTGSGDTAKIQAAVNLAANTDTVLVPAGTCNLTGTVSWTNKAIVLRGAGVDVTTLNYNGTALQIDVSTSAGLAFRVTGLTIAGSLPGGTDGMLVYGLALTSIPTTRFRIDHIKLNHPSDNDARQLYIHGPMWGVIDHAAFICGGCLNTDFSAQTDAEYNGGQLAGNTSANTTLGLGTDTAVYVEDSTFAQSSTSSTWGYNDATHGARLVWRYNAHTGNAHWQTHATRGDQRGGIKSEIYNNVWTGVTYGGITAFVPISLRSGTGVIFNNTITGSYQNLDMTMDNQRCPTGDNCQVGGSPLGLCTGANSYDGNVEANGWPCYDQIGRNSSNQSSQPLYLWNNGPQQKCANPSASGAACDGSRTIFINCNASAAAWIKTTPHSNGAKDYCVGTTTMPGSCGTHTNTYTPYTYPHPLTGGGVATASSSTVAPAAPTNVRVAGGAF